MPSSTFMPRWLFERFILRRSLRNPVRLLLLLCAIAVSTTLVSSVLRVSLASVTSFEESLGYSGQEYPLIVTPRGGRLSMREVGRCLSSLRDTFTVVAYRREVGEVKTPTGPRAVSVIGVTGVQDRSTSELGQQSGIVTSERMARSLGCGEGGSLTLTVAGRSIDGPLTLDPKTAGLAMEGVFVPLSWLSRDEGEVIADAILLKPQGSAPVEEYQRSLAHFLPSCAALSVPIQVDTVTGRGERNESLVAAYRFNIMIMAGMTLLVCALLISQATQLSLRSLARELSVLQTLGVGKIGCFAGIVLEAAIVGGAGGVLGVTVGEPLTVRLTELFLQTAHDIYNLNVGGGDSLYLAQRVSVVVGMVIMASVGAALGTFEALRVSPSVGTRVEHLHVKPISERWAIRLAVVSCALFVAALVAATLSTSAVCAYLFIAACLGLVAGCTPAALSIAPRALWWSRGSLLMWFARGGIQVGGRGFLLGAIGAALSMTLICSLSLMVGSFRTTLEGWTLQRLQGDLFVSAPLEGTGNDPRIPSDLATRVRGLQGVRRVIPYYETMTTYDGRPLVVSASRMEDQLARGIYVVRAGVLEKEPLISGRAALLSESAARKLHLSIGDSMAIEGRRVVVTAIIQEFGTEHPLVLIDEGLFLDLYPRQPPENLTIDLEGNVSPRMVKGDLESVVGAVGVVRDNRELREYALTLFDRTFQITLSIRWIVFGIALLGMVLTALQNLWERRREIKTMRVIGFSPEQIIGAHVVENAVVCALPVVLGLVGGVALGWGLTEFVNPRAFGWSITFTLSAMPALVGFAFIVGVAFVTLVAIRVVLKGLLEEATLSDE
jgi:putative ABC transport system permease protein